MKVCPSCNASIAKQAVSCPKCGHDFDAVRPQKKTMMGLPALGAEESEDEVDSTEGFRFPISGGDRGMEEVTEDPELKTEVVSADSLPFDFDSIEGFGDEEEENEKASEATRQVDPKSVFDALKSKRMPRGGAKATAFGLPTISNKEDDDDSADSAAAAWGVADDSSPEEDAGATKVVDPDTLSGLDLGEESSGGQDQRFGTLMGMSLEEEAAKEAGAGAMQVGHSDDGGEEEHAATAALSAAELSKLDEMGFGDDSDDWDDDGPAKTMVAPADGRLKPGAKKNQSPDDDLKTAVLGSSSASKGFQLPKPSSKAPIGAPSTAKKDEDEKGKEFGGPSAPQSGVFRSVRRGQTKSDSGESTSGREKQKDSGVLGTGTYQMSNTDSTSGSDPRLDERDLKLGALGGARTSFPAGGSAGEEKKTPASDEERPRESVAAPQATTDSSIDSTPEVSTSDSRPPSTGPRFQIGQDSAGMATSTEAPRGDSATASEFESEIPDVDVEEVQWEELDAGGMDQTPMAELTPEPLEPELGSPTPELESPAAKDVAVQRAGDFAAQPAADFGAQPAGDYAAQPAGDFGAQPAGDFGAQPAGDFGAQPAADFGAQPAGDFGAQPAADYGAQPATTDDSADDEEEAGSDLERLVALAQMGSGILAGLVLLLVAILSVVTGGMPDGAAATGVLLAPIVLGLGAVVVSPVPMASQLKSAVFGLVGMTVLLGFLASLAVEMGLLLAIGQFAGAIFLFFAAGFPLLGRLATR